MKSWTLAVSFVVSSISTWANAKTDEPPWTFHSEAVICLMAPGEPWKAVDRGVFKRRVSDGRVDYYLAAGGRTSRWREETTERGTITYGAPSLMHYLEPLVKASEKWSFPPDRMPQTGGPVEVAEARTSIFASGEVEDTLGPYSVRSVIGPECPK